MWNIDLGDRIADPNISASCRIIPTCHANDEPAESTKCVRGIQQGLSVHLYFPVHRESPALALGLQPSSPAIMASNAERFTWYRQLW